VPRLKPVRRRHYERAAERSADWPDLDRRGPFYEPRKPFRNWSALPFYQLDLLQPPHVDQDQLEQGIARALVYLERIRSQGYTGIVIDNLAHLWFFRHGRNRHFMK
jgi:hypothetical protein